MERNLFEIATRKKYRFPYNGLISTEDLWDLSVEKLDGIFKKLSKEKKADEEESLLTPETKNTELDDRIEIVKAVVAYKLAEIEKAKKAASIKQKNQRIMEIIAQKKDEALKSLSIDELTNMLENSDL